MRTESVQCNHCGAPLELPESARFATCRHCGSPLAVHRSADVVTTEVMERVAETVEQMADQVRELRVQTELQRLASEWESERQSLLVRGKHGSVHEPSETMGISTIVIAVVIGLFFAGFAINSGFAMGAFMGLVVMGIGVFSGWQILQKSQQLQLARQRYDRRRMAAVRGDFTEQPLRFDSPPSDAR